jgi:hypothetical protein
MIIDVTNPPVCFFLHLGWARTPISNLVWLDSNSFSHLILHLLIPLTPIGQTDPGLSSGTEIGSNSV